ncbi:MAG: RES domain-containing protein [Spirochaetes bacterium]|nr:MAG: RES domain-containing protein [Spirochaetota bacterium]
MVLYRVSKLRHADDLSGKGAELPGGRWNKKGYPAIYLAENISLAILETIVHCQCINDLHNRLILSFEVPDSSIKVYNRSLLPPDWNSIPWNNYTIENGTIWLESRETLLLKVPSSIVPNENIFILNPKHVDFQNVRIINREILQPDNRLVLAQT